MVHELALVLAIVLAQLGLPVLLVTLLWPPEVMPRIQRWRGPTASRLVGWMLLSVVGLAVLAVLWISLGWAPVPSSWDTATRLQAAQTVATVLAFLVAAAAGWFAGHQWAQSRRLPLLRVEWRSTLFSESHDWAASGVVVPAWESAHAYAGWHVELRVMNYGTLAASSVLVEIQAAATDLKLYRARHAFEGGLDSPGSEEWQAEPQWSSGWIRVGHLRPSSLVYPRTPPAITYHLVLVEAPHEEVSPEKLVVTFRALSAEQRQEPVAQELVLDLERAREILRGLS